MLKDLHTAFGGQAEALLDFAQYMLSRRSGTGQFLPSWSRHNATCQNWDPAGEEGLKDFLTESADQDSLNAFYSRWTFRNITDGKVYLCYDAIYCGRIVDGATLLEQGEAVDDLRFFPFDTNYILRQSDGIPLAFLECPGDGYRICNAAECIAFLENLLRTLGPQRFVKASAITVLCVTGYLSQEDLEDLDRAGIRFLLRLSRSTYAAAKHIASKVTDLPACEQKLLRQENEAFTEIGPLLDGEEADRHFHITWDSQTASYDSARLTRQLTRSENGLQRYAERGDAVLDEAIQQVMPFWNLTLKTDSAAFDSGQVGYRILSYERNQAQIARETTKCGYRVMVSSSSMTAQEALACFEKPSCVKAVLSSVQQDLQEDELGKCAFEMRHVKTAACLIAAILYTLIQNKTEALRKEDAEVYSVPSIIDSLDAICANYNQTRQQYERRYALTAEQAKLLDVLGIKVEDVDDFIRRMER